MKITRRKLKELLFEAVSGGVSGRPNYHSFVGPDGDLRVVDEPGYDIDSYDVEQLAAFHALNGDVDATLYRDNPDYRDAFIDMIVMKFGEERMQQFQGEEEEKEERRLLMDPDFDDPTEDDDLDDMGQVPFSKDYEEMIASEPYDIDESIYRRSGMSDRYDRGDIRRKHFEEETEQERRSMGIAGGDGDYDPFDPDRPEFMVDNRPATATEREEAQQRAIETRRQQERDLAAIRKRYRAILGPDY